MDEEATVSGRRRTGSQPNLRRPVHLAPLPHCSLPGLPPCPHLSKHLDSSGKMHTWLSSSGMEMYQALKFLPRNLISSGGSLGCGWQRLMPSRKAYAWVSMRVTGLKTGRPTGGLKVLRGERGGQETGEGSRPWHPQLPARHQAHCEAALPAARLAARWSVCGGAPGPAAW